MKFNIFARKDPKEAQHMMGLEGLPSDVRQAAKADIKYQVKKPLLEGALAAYAQGRKENIAAFVSGYLEFKRDFGYINAMVTQEIDEGCERMLCGPLLTRMEKSADPVSVFDDFSKDLTPYYRQTLLDLMLRFASYTDAWSVGQVLIRLGADVNTASGRPLYHAVKSRSNKMTALLIATGADNKALFPRTQWDSQDKTYYRHALALAQQAPKPAPVPELRAIEKKRLPPPEIKR
jgi:hypothetical protein